MTLIVSAVKKDIAAVASDGLEFRHRLDGTKYIETRDRQKVFPIPERNALLAVHGQNRLTTRGNDLNSQRLIGDMLNDLYPELTSIPTIEGIANRLFDLLTPDVDHTFNLLRTELNHNSPLGIVVIGFDLAGGRTRGFETYWPSLDDQSSRRGVIQHVFEKDDVRLVYSGTGSRYAKSVIARLKFKYDPNKLKRATIQNMRTYLSGVFRDSAKQQAPAESDFGGHCQLIIVERNAIDSSTFDLELGGTR